MGSLAPQFQTVAEIWRDEVGPYARVFGKMYGKIAKNRYPIFDGNANAEPLGGQISVKSGTYQTYDI
jgi:hypothetical protein